MALTSPRIISLLAAAVAMTTLPACNQSLPETFPVRLPDGSTVDAARGSGISSLATSRKIILNTDGDPSMIGRIEFGASGEVVQVLDQQIAAESLGPTIVLDGLMHPTGWPTMTYHAVTFAAENESGIGFAGVGKAYLGPFLLATTTWEAWGTLQGDQIVGTLRQTTVLDPESRNVGIFNDYSAEWPILAIPDEMIEDPYEPNDEPAQATSVAPGQIFTGSINPAGEADWYRFAIGQASSVDLQTSGNFGDTVIYLFDESMNQLGEDDDGAANHFSRLQFANLPAGTYYAVVIDYYSDLTIGRYDFSVTATAIPVVEPFADPDEPDQSPSQAAAIALGQTKTKSLSPAFDEDWLTFTLTDATSVEIETTGTEGDTIAELYDSAMNLVAMNDDSGSSLFSFIFAPDLPGGTYFIRIREFHADRVLNQYEVSLRQSAGSVNNPPTPTLRLDPSQLDPRRMK